jgi:hypothetical protein
MARAINIGKLKNIRKLNITLIFNKNIRIYSLKVVLKFRIAILEEVQTALNVDLFHNTISYLE